MSEEVNRWALTKGGDELGDGDGEALAKGRLPKKKARASMRNAAPTFRLVASGAELNIVDPVEKNLRQASVRHAKKRQQAAPQAKGRRGIFEGGGGAGVARAQTALLAVCLRIAWRHPSLSW